MTDVPVLADSHGKVYGLRLKGSIEYRYVGITTKPASVRLRQHLRLARIGTKRPVYDWLRKHDPGEVVTDVLEEWDVLEDLGRAERRLIARLRSEGHRLLNISEGGLGPTGVVWSAEQREAARKRSTGRKGLSRPGPANPFYGMTHSAERREAWSRDRQGSITGEKNPNYGKFGAAHPSFGRIWSDETRARLSESKRGENNPNFGKKASPESLRKRSVAQKGKPRPENRRNAHTRHHTNKNIHKPSCQYCAEDARMAEKSAESAGKT